MKKCLVFIWLLGLQPLLFAVTDIFLSIQLPVLSREQGCHVLLCNAAAAIPESNRDAAIAESGSQSKATGPQRLARGTINLAVSVNSDTARVGDLIQVDIKAYKDQPEQVIVMTQPPKVSLLGPDGAIESNFLPIAHGQGYSVSIATQGRPSGPYWLHVSYGLTDVAEAPGFRKQLFLIQTSDLTRASTSPRTFALHQNYPNPFNPGTTITFDLPIASRIEIEIFNNLGQSVRKLINAQAGMGTHTVQWDGNDESGNKLGTGIYYCYFRASAQNGTGFENFIKMILIR